MFLMWRVLSGRAAQLFGAKASPKTLPSCNDLIREEMVGVARPIELDCVHGTQRRRRRLLSLTGPFDHDGEESKWGADPAAALLAMAQSPGGV